MKIIDNENMDVSGIFVNHEYEPHSGEEAISAQALIQNLQLVEAQIALRPETHDFAKGFMVGLLLGSQRPDEIFSVVQEMVAQVSMKHLIPFQHIGDAVMGEIAFTDCGEHEDEQA